MWAACPVARRRAARGAGDAIHTRRRSQAPAPPVMSQRGRVRRDADGVGHLRRAPPPDPDAAVVAATPNRPDGGRFAAPSQPPCATKPRGCSGSTLPGLAERIDPASRVESRREGSIQAVVPGFALRRASARHGRGIRGDAQLAGDEVEEITVPQE